MNATQICELRELLQMTQKEFAKKLGVADGTVKRWESGKCPPRGSSAIMLEELAAKFRRRVAATKVGARSQIAAAVADDSATVVESRPELDQLALAQSLSEHNADFGGPRPPGRPRRSAAP